MKQLWTSLLNDAWPEAPNAERFMKKSELRETGVAECVVTGLIAEETGNG